MSHIVGKLQLSLPARPGGKGPTGFTCHMSPPCSSQAIVHAESDLGFCLPEPLKEMYTIIGPGGFGPGYGAMRARISMIHTNGTTGEHSHRMLKKPVQQGR